MIITINNDDGTTTYDVNNIEDDSVKQEATVIVQKVGNLQVVIEALDFASRTHRANLEELLKSRDEAIVDTPEPQAEETQEEESTNE
jgi:ribonuclease PH